MQQALRAAGTLALLAASCSPPAVRPTDVTTATEMASTPSLCVRPDSVMVVAEPTLGAVLGWTPEGEEAWRFTLDANEQVITPPVVAANSYTYVRTQNRIIILQEDGTLRWEGNIIERVDPAAASLATLPNSAVVFASSPRKLLALGPDGERLWSFQLPEGDVFTSGPVSGAKDSLFILTQAAYVRINTDGLGQWYRLRASIVEP